MADKREFASSNLGGGTGRDKSVDILKGIAMILIVTGHAYTPHRDWIYLFHVAVFFMASGYCWHKEIHTANEWLRYVTRKVKELYIPYLIYNGIYVLATNIFIKLNVYTNDTEFLALTEGRAFPQKLTEFNSLKDAALMLLKTALLKYRPEMGGATWFVSILMLILVIHSTFELLIWKLGHGNRFARRILYGILFAALLVFPELSFTRRLLMHWEFVRLPYPYAAFLLGMILRFLEKKIDKGKVYNVIIGAVTFTGLCLMYRGGVRIEISSGEIQNPFVFLIASLFGWVFLLSASKFILARRINILASCLTYIGTHTVPILYLHFLAFKLASLIVINAESLPVYMLASFPVVFTASGMYKALYVVSGVGVPLLLNSVMFIAKEKLLISRRFKPV